jgi:hypothetical protein
MERQIVETRTRSIVFSVVLVLHLATLALLLATSQHISVAESEKSSIQLVFIAATPAPKARVENIVPRGVNINISIEATSPVSVASSQTGTSSGSDGHGTAVNWTAEAHRALRAFEIRRDQIPSSAQSVSMPLDELGSRSPRTGDRLKTNSGDWIVWINSNCYRVASWHSNPSAFDAISAQTICKNHGIAPD